MVESGSRGLSWSQYSARLQSGEIHSSMFTKNTIRPTVPLLIHMEHCLFMWYRVYTHLAP
jgi:hypothetical protein